MTSFSTGKLKKNYFGPITNLVSFSTAQTEKNSWNGEANLMNLFIRLSR